MTEPVFGLLFKEVGSQKIPDGINLGWCSSQK